MEEIIGIIIFVIFCILVAFVLYMNTKKSRQKAALTDLFKQYIQPNITVEKEKEIKHAIEEMINIAKIMERDIAAIKESVISSVITKIGEDLIFTDDEAKYFKACLNKLGVKITDEDEKNLRTWQEHSNILKGQISPIQVDYKLSKDEAAYFISKVSLKELKHYSGRSKYAAPYDQLIEKDKGDIILTNSRVIFVGPTKNISIKFDKILMIKPYKDCIELHKGAGTPYYFMFQEPIKFFFMYKYLSQEKPIPR
ncbi:MAG: hypothetical protein PHH60_01460 [Candidatus Margulisbacteria bacterium]|nr:hypothetical protein [Candidatus Margulisiibacteriota bacterium]